MANEDKKRALDAAIAKLEKDFGKGTVMRLGDPAAQVAVETIPTGSLSLDLALGLGGVPKGRIVEIYGPESSGKTTVALHMIAEVQKRGGIAGFIDAEHALDPVYAKNIGVDIDELYISQPDSGDQALEITETMVRSGAMDIIVVDSVAALVPKQEIEDGQRNNNPFRLTQYRTGRIDEQSGRDIGTGRFAGMPAGSNSRRCGCSIPWRYQIWSKGICTESFGRRYGAGN